MKKVTFYKVVRTKNGKDYLKDTGYLEQMDRWSVVFHKVGKYWQATDIDTGIGLGISEPTRKKCFERARDEIVPLLNEKGVGLEEKYNRAHIELHNWLELQGMTPYQTANYAEFGDTGSEESLEKIKKGENEMKQTKKRAKGQTVGVCEHSEVVEWKNVVKVKDKASIKKLEKKEKPANWARNEEHQGIEITFKEKPEKSIRDMLKSVGFRWHNTKQLWYAKETEARVKVAEMVCA